MRGSTANTSEAEVAVLQDERARMLELTGLSAPQGALPERIQPSPKTLRIPCPHGPRVLTERLAVAGLAAPACHGERLRRLEVQQGYAKRLSCRFVAVEYGPALWALAAELKEWRPEACFRVEGLDADELAELQRSGLPTVGDEASGDVLVRFMASSEPGPVSESEAESVSVWRSLPSAPVPQSGARAAAFHLGDLVWGGNEDSLAERCYELTENEGGPVIEAGASAWDLGADRVDAHWESLLVLRAGPEEMTI